VFLLPIPIHLSLKKILSKFFLTLIANTNPNPNTKREIIQFCDQNEKGEKLYYTFEPIKIGNTLTPWSIGIAVPISDIMAKANQSYNTSFLIGLIGLIIAILIAYLVSNNITVPIKKITHILNEFAKGKIVNIDIKTSSNDEIGQMIKAMNASWKV
jgi:sensor histidine kinase YesM